jgi:hypothetical protein
MPKKADFAEKETGVNVLHCGKAATPMSAASLLKRKLRGYPVGSLSIRVTGA